MAAPSLDHDGSLTARIRSLCLAFPDATEKLAWGTPTFRARGKVFAMMANNHHGDGMVGVWCKAAPAEQDALVRSDSRHFYVPAYVGGQGWVGIRVDLDDTDWPLVQRLLHSGYQHALPRPAARSRR